MPPRHRYPCRSMIHRPGQKLNATKGGARAYRARPRSRRPDSPCGRLRVAPGVRADEAEIGSGNDPREHREQAIRGRPPATGRHRRGLQRCRHRAGPRRAHPSLEPGSRADVRLLERRGSADERRGPRPERGARSSAWPPPGRRARREGHLGRGSSPDEGRTDPRRIVDHDRARRRPGAHRRRRHDGARRHGASCGRPARECRGGAPKFRAVAHARRQHPRPCFRQGRAEPDAVRQPGDAGGNRKAGAGGARPQ